MLKLKQSSSFLFEVMQQRSAFTLSQQSPSYQPPHLHITSGDEALVLDITHLEEFVGFLPDSVLSHVPVFRFTRLFAASLPLPCCSSPHSGHCIGGSTRGSKSCHDLSESVDECFPRPSHEPGTDRGVEGRGPGDVELQPALHQRLSPMSPFVIS